MSAIGYQVLVDSVSILRDIGKITDSDGKVIGYEHESVLYPLSAIIPESEISPVVLDKYESGDEHTRNILQRVPLDEQKPVSKPKGRVKGVSEEPDLPKK